MIPIAIFVRVSSRGQDYERQIQDLTNYAAKHDLHIAYQIEEVVSATKTAVEHRKAIRDLLELAGSGKISKVLVTEISRLGRKTSEVLKVIEDLTSHKVSVYALNYNLETLTKDLKRNPIASLLFTLLAEFSRMETEVLSERIRSGKSEATRKGRKQGRPEGSTVDLLKEYPAIVKDLKEGLSIRKTAAFRKVSADTVRRVKKQLDSKNLD